MVEKFENEWQATHMQGFLQASKDLLNKASGEEYTVCVDFEDGTPNRDTDYSMSDTNKNMCILPLERILS